MYISMNQIDKEIRHVSKSYIIVYQTLDDARKNPNGFLEGSLRSFSETLSNRMNIKNELIKPETGFVVLEHRTEVMLNESVFFARVITDSGFVGWVLSAEPPKPDFDEDW